MCVPASQTLTVAATGASGVALTRTLLLALEREARVGHVDLVVSPHGLRVMREELAVAEGRLDQLPERLLGHAVAKIEVHDNRDIGANIASGSYPNQGMIVLPCSMGTCAAIAHGLADSLIARAADVCLKERRRLVLAVREAPLNRIHLRNLLAADEAGAVVFPVTPAFYDHARTPEATSEQFVARLLSQFDLTPATMFQWQG